MTNRVENTLNPSLYASFLKSSKNNSERIFISDENLSLTFSRALSHVNRAAHILRDKNDIKKDGRVGLLISNRVEFVIIVLALNKLGACFMPINTMLKRRDVEYIAESSNMQLLLYENCYSDLASGISACPAAAMKDIFGGEIALEDDSYQTQDIAAVFFTSGTTGKPKGVMLGNDSFFNCADIIIRGCDLEHGMRQLIVSPLYHVYPFFNQLVPGILLGHTLFLLNYESISQVMAVMEKERVNVLQAAPSLYALIAMSDLSETHKLTDAAVFGYSGGPMQRNVLESLRNDFPHVKLINSYGSSEAGGTVSVLPDKDALIKEDCVGIAGHGVDIKVLNQQNAFITDKIGEVVVKNVCMKGYVNQDSSGKFHAEYLRTGDAGLISSDGYLYIKGRVDDMMIVNGTNIYPSDVEHYFSECGIVVDIAVSSRTSFLGDQIVAFVEVSAPKDRALEALKKFADEHVPDYKKPLDYIILDELPRGPTGKVVKMELEKQLQ